MPILQMVGIGERLHIPQPLWIWHSHVSGRQVDGDFFSGNAAWRGGNLLWKQHLLHGVMATVISVATTNGTDTGMRRRNLHLSHSE